LVINLPASIERKILMLNYEQKFANVAQVQLRIFVYLSSNSKRNLLSDDDLDPTDYGQFLEGNDHTYLEEVTLQ